MLNLSRETEIVRVSNAAVAATTDVECTVLDMQNWEGVMFVAAFGALTSNQVTLLKAQQGKLSNGTDMKDLTGAATAALEDTDGNKMLVVDVYQPQERYVRAVVDRGTANAVVDGVLAFLYGPRKLPVAQHTTVKEIAFAQSPDEAA